MVRNERRIARRKFLFGAAAIASWTLGRSSFVRASDPPRTIGLGFSLYGMRSLATGAALRAVAEIGYDCVELPVMSDWPADSARLAKESRRELRGQLVERGLRLTSLMENLRLLADDAQHHANLDRLKRAAELAHDLAPEQPAGVQPHMPLIETILGGAAGEFDVVKERFALRLRDWSKVLAEAKVLLAIKAHVNNATQRPEQLVWLLNQVASPWLQAAYDYSHFQIQGLALKETLNLMLPQTVFIHVKDTEHAQGKRGFLLPGEGTIDYAALLRQVGASAYRGDVIVEVSSQISNKSGYDPLAAARQCYNHLADAFTRSGVKRG